ncbi:UNVERIFIED_CONTAM: hypothetical protein Slati_1712700 [Sesamum latifolium]|uniref:Reverse transcriptase Ty1/copia-type domain-containing protein n=1 Tax=Sesamum latifolium TaxID=2727402 RepID=A0AAW2WWN5_9LAMI
MVVGEEQKVCHLQRSIYGLKQASRSWKIHFNEVIRGYNFIKNDFDPCVYKKVSGSSVEFLLLCVDDILLVENDVKMLGDTKAWLSTQFSMKDLKSLEKVQDGALQTKIPSDEIDEELKRMLDVPYASAAGSNQYVVQCTRPDIAYALSVTSRYQACAGEAHWTAIKTILKYLRRTKYMFLLYGGGELILEGYSDASFQWDDDDAKSQSGFVVRWIV